MPQLGLTTRLFLSAAQDFQSTDKHRTWTVVIRRTDGGRSHFTPYDIYDCMPEEDRYNSGFISWSHRDTFQRHNKISLIYKLDLNLIGNTRDGGQVVVNDPRVFGSEDEGPT